MTCSHGVRGTSACSVCVFARAERTERAEAAFAEVAHAAGVEHGEGYPDVVRAIKETRSLADRLEDEVAAARTAVGLAWFYGGATLAEAIERKCRALEGRR